MTVNDGKGKTARAIFSPAIALLNRLSYTEKFTLLWLISSVAIAAVTYSLFVSLDRVIQPSQRELQGITLIEPVSRTVQRLQLHRGISAALLGGNETMQDRRAAQEREAAEAFGAMEGKLPPGLTSGKDFRNIKSSWEELRKEGLHWTADENFAAHTRLIERLQSFRVSIADGYALILDAELDTYYLIDTNINKLPSALEYLGQLRAYGTGILARKQITERQKIKLNNLIAGLDSALNELSINIEKTGRYSPAVQKSLLAAYDGIAGSARQITGLVASDILAGRFATPPDVFLDMATAEIDNGYAQMHGSLLPTAKALIEARIARAEDTLFMNVSLALLLFLAAGYLSISLYYAIAGSVKSLVRSAHSFAEGDLDQRVRLGTRDEFSRIGDSFNRMAEGFNALLEERKKAEEALRESEIQSRAVFEQAAVGIARVAPDGRWLEVNQRLCDIVGYTREELLPLTFQDITHPDDLNADLEYVRRMLAGEIQTYSMEKRYFRKDGAIVWINLTVSLVHEPSGVPKYFISVVEDVTVRKQAERAMMESRQQAQHYLNVAGVMLLALDATGKVRMINRKGCEMLGLPSVDILGRDWFDNYVPESSRKEIRAVFVRIMAGDIASFERHENDILAADGRIRSIEWHNSLLLDESGRITGTLSSGEDITERRQAERALAESHEKLQSVIETALDAVVQMDAGGIITGWNAQAEKVFGWSRAEAIGRALGETIIPPRYRQAHRQGLERFLASGEGAILNSRIELTGLHRDGSEFPVELGITPVRVAGGYEFSGFIRDVTERKKAEEAIWKEANFDALTGLPNRHMFYDRLAQELRKAERIRLPMAMLYIDLDRFKEINDTLGHSMGDKVLVETARRIGACVRETDTVARLGGDEFIIILTELGETTRIDALAQNILSQLAEPFHLNGEAIFLSASIGITLYPHDAAAMEELVKNADQAMYAAKNTGRNRFSYFTQSLQEAAQNRMRLIGDLRGALAAGQLRLHYQPIVDLLTGSIHKAEALIRWQHPQRGPVSPIEFIPLAEETGLILGIGDWVFREAARQVKRWRAHYDPEFQVSVNMSPAQFRGSSSPCRAWPAYLREAGLPGQSLVIEITEGLLLEKEQGVMDRLLQFHEAGVQVSLDDFGTGYSSLSYLQKFDIDYLKIDQSFTRKLEPGSGNLALSEAIIVMAHRLGLKVIAEGVETEAQRDLLAVAGCDYGQGYLFSKPLPAAEFEKLLKAAAEGGQAK